LTKIEELTPEQEARFPEFVRKWTDIGLSTAPADRPRAEAAIRWMYRQANLAEPRIVWCGSPLGNALARAIVSTTNSVESSVRSSVESSVRSSVRSSVESSVRSSVESSVESSVWSSVRSSVWSRVESSVWSRVYGQHDAGWLAFYDFFASIGLQNEVKPLHGLNELAQSAGWALPHKEICWVSERHNVLNRDARGRLHCESGPACAYPDGWAIYVWHGVRVTENVLMRPADQITLDEVLKENNAEVARVLITRAGARLWDDPRIKVLDADTDGAGQPRQLLHAQVGNGQPAAIVRVKCPSTGGEYRLHVPPDVRTCRDAVAWTFQLPASDYAPAVET
jgi:hypothetical protein